MVARIVAVAAGREGPGGDHLRLEGRLTALPAPPHDEGISAMPRR
jgi:hypothetical protein